jgi:hypothetical protein
MFGLQMQLDVCVSAQDNSDCLSLDSDGTNIQKENFLSFWIFFKSSVFWDILLYSQVKVS